MIETRPLTKIEMNMLIAEAPESETSNLVHYLNVTNQDSYDFLNRYAVYKFGLIIDKRPIYLAYIVQQSFDKYELWTVVNSNVKQQFSLYKYSKRSLDKALELFSPIYATMQTHNLKNLEWVKHMGFEEISRYKNTVTFKIERRS